MGECVFDIGFTLYSTNFIRVDFDAYLEQTSQEYHEISLMLEDQRNTSVIVIK